MRVICAQKLLLIKPEDAIKGLAGCFILRFSDGDELITDSSHTVYSMNLWEPLRESGGALVTKDHHISTYGNYNNSSNVSVISSVWKTVFKFMRLDEASKEVLSDFMKLSFKSIGTLYNFVIENLGDYKMGMDAIDILYVYNHPRIKDARDMVVRKEISVSKGYRLASEAIMNDEDLKKSSMGIFINSGASKKSQAMQVIIGRGYISDVDGCIFREPVLGNFYDGLSDLYSFIIESRSNVKALSFANTLISESGYSSRKTRLLSSYLEKIVPGDCGSKVTLPWFIRPSSNDENGFYRGDLPGLEGKKYVDNGVIKTIMEGDNHLSGKVVMLRSADGCRYGHSQKICSTCFGDLYYNTVAMGNIGSRAAIEQSIPLMQSIIGQKHDDSMGGLGKMFLDESVKHVLDISKSGLRIKIKGKKAAEGLRLVIDKEEVPAIMELIMDPDSSDIKELVQRMSSITSFGYYYLDDDKVNDLPLIPHPVTCVLTMEMIDHMALSSMGFDDNGNAVFDMTGFDARNDIVIIPSVSHGRIQDVRLIKRAVEGSSDSCKERLKDGAMRSELRSFFDIANSSIDINLSVLEVIMLSASITSYSNHSIPKSNEENYLGSIIKTMSERSLGPVIGFEGRINAVMSSRAHSKENKMSHVLDAMIMPREVVDAIHKKERALRSKKLTI